MWSIVLSVLMIALAWCDWRSRDRRRHGDGHHRWLLVLSGLLHVAFAWRARRAGAVVWEVLLGIVYGAIGSTCGEPGCRSSLADAGDRDVPP